MTQLTTAAMINTYDDGRKIVCYTLATDTDRETLKAAMRQELVNQGYDQSVMDLFDEQPVIKAGLSGVMGAEVFVHTDGPIPALVIQVRHNQKVQWADEGEGTCWVWWYGHMNLEAFKAAARKEIFEKNSEYVYDCEWEDEVRVNFEAATPIHTWMTLEMRPHSSDEFFVFGDEREGAVRFTYLEFNYY